MSCSCRFCADVAKQTRVGAMCFPYSATMLRTDPTATHLNYQLPPRRPVHLLANTESRGHAASMLGSLADAHLCYRSVRMPNFAG